VDDVGLFGVGGLFDAHKAEHPQGVELVGRGGEVGLAEQLAGAQGDGLAQHVGPHHEPTLAQEKPKPRYGGIGGDVAVVDGKILIDVDVADIILPIEGVAVRRVNREVNIGVVDALEGVQL
jgi:hypothetical protein